MSASGWVRFYRQALENGWLRNPVLWTFWCYCLLKATHTETTVTVGYQRVPLEAGQFVFGREKAAAELLMSVKSVRTCLEHLKRAGNLTIKSASKFSVITIVNWHIYQMTGDEVGHQNGHQEGQQRAIKGPARGHKQECKERGEKEVRQDIPFVEIFEHLNKTTGRRFKGSESDKRHVRARWKEGHRIEDFMRVIDGKALEWGTDSKMAAYLRPETLFGPKFDGYLQSATKATSGQAAEPFEPLTLEEDNVIRRELAARGL